MLRFMPHVLRCRQSFGTCPESVTQRWCLAAEVEVGARSERANWAPAARGTALLVFARSPHADARRKLRGAGAGAGASAAAALLTHTLDVARTVGATVVLAGDTDVHQRAPAEVTVQPQQGAGFGARFRNAVASVFAAGFERVVAIGADVPGLTADLLEDAIARLERGDARTVVLGPSRDGGYYLVGLNRFDERVFTGIPWHTSNVFACTRRALADCGIELLRCLTDADDAGSLRVALRDMGGAPPSVRRLLGRVASMLVSRAVVASRPSRSLQPVSSQPLILRGPPVTAAR